MAWQNLDKMGVTNQGRLTKLTMEETSSTGQGRADKGADSTATDSVSTYSSADWHTFQNSHIYYGQCKGVLLRLVLCIFRTALEGAHAIL